MAMKKPAKILLQVCVVLYILVIGGFLYLKYTRPEPELREKLVKSIMELSKEGRKHVLVWVDGKDAEGRIVRETPDGNLEVELLDKSVKVVPRSEVVYLTREMNEKLAEEEADRFMRRGEIIGVNYTIVMQWLNFLILLALLYGFLWEPMLKLLDERRERIASDLKTARSGRETVEKEVAELRKERVAAQAERRELREKGVHEGEDERKRIVAAAREEAAKLLDAARQSIGAETEDARADLRNYLAEVSIAAAEKIVAHEIRPEDHEELIRDFLRELDTAEL